MRLSSCTCVRLHFSLVIDQFVKKVGSTINFLLSGYLVQFEKNMLFDFFFFVRKMLLPCSTNLQWRIIMFILGKVEENSP